jgi:hypothetical protein
LCQSDNDVIFLRARISPLVKLSKGKVISGAHWGKAEGQEDQPRQSFLPASSGELEMTRNRKLRVGPSQRKSTNSRSRAWAHLYKLPHVVGGPIS